MREPHAEIPYVLIPGPYRMMISSEAEFHAESTTYDVHPLLV